MKTTSNENSFMQDQSSSNDTVSYRDGTGWIVFGYIFAVLGGLFGIAIGAVLALSTKRVNGKKYKVYCSRAVINGWIILILAFCSMIFWKVYYA